MAGMLTARITNPNGKSFANMINYTLKLKSYEICSTFIVFLIGD